MRILLTNDDGFDAHGLALLHEIASTLSNDVWICAPTYEQSGAGRGVSLHDPVRVKQVAEKSFSVFGTPTDCVQIAINELLPSPPDLVLSGINRGFNLAQDLTLSGTVAGALQGMTLGVPSIALSQCLDFDSDDEAQWDCAKAHCAPVLSALLDLGWPSDVILNINFPFGRADAVTGIEITKQGFRDNHAMHAVKCVDPRGNAFYWMGFDKHSQVLVDHTDLNAIAMGRISVTPLHLDLTHLETMHSLRQSLGGTVPGKIRPM